MTLSARCILALLLAVSATAFTMPKLESATLSQSRHFPTSTVWVSTDDEVLELVEDEVQPVEEKEPEKAVAPFLSQGEVSEEAMEMDLSDPKQARVMFYIILSLLPVLFLIPLMLGSREMIPADIMPPVEM